MFFHRFLSLRPNRLIPAAPLALAMLLVTTSAQAQPGHARPQRISADAHSPTAPLIAAAEADNIRPPADPNLPDTTLLVTHPLRQVLDNYIALVARGVVRIPNLKIIGIYHASEREDYAESQRFLAETKLDWITLHPVDCPISIEQIFAKGTCRKEFAELIAKSQGAVFNGGDDIPPFLYGQPTLLTTNVQTPRRHVFETALLVQMLGSMRAPKVQPLLKSRRDYTVLGICVGMQTMNIAAGGTLYQDIPSQLYHQQSSEEALSQNPLFWHRNHSHETGLGSDEGVSLGVMHPVHVTPRAPSFMQEASSHGQREPEVLSIHHQAVDQVGAGYAVFATSDDGKIVEAIGRNDFPNVLGVQWHPERKAMWDATIREQLAPHDKEHNFVFDAVANDPYTRAINLGVWQWLADHTAKPGKKGAKARK